MVGVLLRNSRWMPLTLSALAKVGADAVLLNTGFAGPQLADVLSARVHGRSSTTTNSRACSRTPSSRCPICCASSDGATATTVELPTLADLAARRRAATCPVPRHRSRQVILTSGTTGAPKGASRSLERHRAGGRVPVRDSAACQGDHRHRLPALPHLGSVPISACRCCCSRRSCSSRKFDAEGTLRLIRGATGQRAGRGAGDAAADARARRKGAQQIRHLLAAGRRGQRIGVARRAVHQLHGRLRRRRLQHVRLDRGGVRDRRRDRTTCGRRREPRGGR